MPSLGLIHTTVDSTVTSTSTSFTEVAESSALTDGTDYYIIATGLVEGSSNSKVFEWQLVDRTSGDAVLTNSTVKREPNTADKCQSYSFVGKITAGRDGGGLAFEQKAASASTVRTQYLSILILDLSSLAATDFFYATDDTVADHTTTLADRVTHTLTSRVDGETWLVFGWVATAMDNVGRSAEALLYYEQGASNSSEPLMLYEGEDNTEQLSAWVCRPYSFTSDTNVTWKIQSRDDQTCSGCQNDYLGSTLLGLRLAAFANSESGYASADQDTTSTDFVQIATETLTPDAAGSVIAVGSAIFDAGDAWRGTYLRLQVDGTTSPNAQPDSETSAVANDPTDQLAIQYATSYTGEAATAAVIDLDAKKTNGASYGWEMVSLAAFTTELFGIVTFSSVAAEAYTSGSKASQSHDAGTVADQTHDAGAVASEARP